MDRYDELDQKERRKCRKWTQKIHEKEERDLRKTNLFQLSGDAETKKVHISSNSGTSRTNNKGYDHLQ